MKEDDKYEEIIDFGIDKEKEILVEKTVWDILDDGRREKVHLLFDSDTWKEIPPDTALRELDIPIISVMGMGPNTNKFYMQLALKKYFEEKDIEYIDAKVGCTVGIHSGVKPCGLFFIVK